jgi:hypothetical protein
MKYILIAVFSLAISLSALADSPKTRASAKRSPIGTLIVYRPGSLVGFGRTYSFSIDNGPRHKLKNDRYMQFELAAGDHILRHPFDITLNYGPDTQKVHINPGQTVYFQYTIYPWMGTVFEVSEDQAEARQTASGLKRQD